RRLHSSIGCVTNSDTRTSADFGALSIVGIALRFRRQYAAKTVNHIALVPIDDVAVGGLHFEAIARCPGTAAQHSPVATGRAAATFVGIGAPFPDISAEIVQA